MASATLSGMWISTLPARRQGARHGVSVVRGADVPPRKLSVQATAFPCAVQYPGAKNVRSSRGALQVVASSAEDKVKSLDRKSRSLDLAVEQDTRAEYSHLLAVVGFIAYWYNKVTVDRLLLIKAFAVVQILVSLVNLVTRIGALDRVTTIIAPVTLAVFVLNFQVSFLDAATALFGYYLSEQMTGPFWLWVATLAAALYYGYGTLWYTVGFGVVALLKFLRSVKSEDRAPLLSVPVVLASIWAVYTERHFVWTLLLYIAQAAWSGYSTLEKLTHKVED